MTDHRTTVHVAHAIHTMDGDYPLATAVAVQAGRIVAVGSVDQVTAALGGVSFDVDTTHAGDVRLPGLATEVIATEGWVLPERTFKAASSTRTTSIQPTCTRSRSSARCTRAVGFRCRIISGHLQPASPIARQDRRRDCQDSAAIRTTR